MNWESVMLDFSYVLNMVKALEHRGVGTRVYSDSHTPRLARTIHKLGVDVPARRKIRRFNLFINFKLLRVHLILIAFSCFKILQLSKIQWAVRVLFIRLVNIDVDFVLHSICVLDLLDSLLDLL